MTPNRSRESGEEIVPKGKPESGTTRGGFRRQSVHQGPGDFECGPLADGMGLPWEQVR